MSDLYNDIIRRDTGIPTKVVGPSTRGGKPVGRDQYRRPGKVLIDPGKPHGTELDLSQLESGMVVEATRDVEANGRIDRPEDLAHQVVQKLASAQRRHREAFEFFQSSQEEAPAVTSVPSSYPSLDPVSSPSGSPEIPMVPSPARRNRDTGSSPPAPAAAPQPREPQFQVTFSRENGDMFEVLYHEVILSNDGAFLTLARDCSSGAGVNFRSGSQEEPIGIRLVKLKPRSHPVDLVCLPTGFQLKHRGWEYTVFVVQDGNEDT